MKLGIRHPGCTIVEAAHSGGNDGLSKKSADKTCVPLGQFHHAQYDGHAGTEITTHEAFEEKYGMDMKQEAASCYALYLAVGS